MDRPNILLRDTCQEKDYTAPQRPRNYTPVKRNRDAHAARLHDELREALDIDKTMRAAALIEREGIYLEFRSLAGEELVTKSLENIREGVRLLNIRDVDGVTAATVFIPKGKEPYFLKKISEYADHAKDTANGNPKNNTLVASIEDVNNAILDSFWTGDKDKKPNDLKQWVEIWLRTGKADQSSTIDSFKCLLTEQQIRHSKESIKFPERVVVLAYANRQELTTLLSRSGQLAEMREAPEATSFFEDMRGEEQQEWVEDLTSRIRFELGNNAICLLDTGVNRSHPLLRDAIDEESVLTYSETWGAADQDGHGTGMAGIALYNDLKARLVSDENITVSQRIESVKIYQSGMDNDPKLYGEITRQAAYRATAAHPERERVFCSAVTANDNEIADGLPTSWSGALDELTSHPGDEDEDRELFFVSAGNVFPETLNGQEYPDANTTRTVRSPGQAWNVVTVGAYSKAVEIHEQVFLDSGYEPVAGVGELSPFSTTSVMWGKGTPIKPEIVCDGGNMVKRDLDYSDCSDLMHLTTGKDVLTRPLVHFGATSAAAAQAAHMAAELKRTYPELWPETIRGLIIHSAEWTKSMFNQFCPPSENSKTRGRRTLLRTCGYGIPDLDAAIHCRNNSVNLIIQGTMVPFCKRNSRPSMNEMHFHTIPWPRDILESMGSARAKLRVTLSYFIEPGPGQIGWKDRYRYPSHGLRFDVNKAGETFEEFQHRINVAAREEDESRATSDSGDWYLGTTNRNVGSIHSDYKEKSAIDLCEIEYVAVYPVIGWWRERHYLGRIDSECRYSLIVSITTPDNDVDLYTAITNQIKIVNAAEVSAVPVEIPTSTRAF